MDYLDRQDQEYRARVEKQQFVEKVKRDAALQERNIKEELPAGPLAERVQRLLDAAAACKESRDWHGACNLYQQVLRFKPDHHPSQLEVKSLAAIINAVAQQDKMEQRQRQFMERMQEPPGMRSLPGVGDKSPLQAPGRVVRSGPHAELTPEMYRQQLVAQMKANKAARAAAAQEEAALEGRVARVNAVELAVQRHASAAKMVQGYEDRRLEMVAKQQARAERWQEENALAARAIAEALQHGGALVGRGERERRVAAQDALIKQIKQAAALEKAGRPSSAALYRNRDGVLQVAFQTIRPQVDDAGAYWAAQQQPSTSAAAQASKPLPASALPTSQSGARGALAVPGSSRLPGSRADAPAVAAVSGRESMVSHRPAGGAAKPPGAYPYSRPDVDAPVAPISPFKVRQRQAVFLAKHARREEPTSAWR